MRGFPRDSTLDATLALRREGYDFISRRCERLGSDAFWTRLFLRPVLCAQGPEAARQFYMVDRFTRKGALPATTLRLLQDKGSVALLDGAAHRHRKAMFLNLLTSTEHAGDIARRLDDAFAARFPEWQARGEVQLPDDIAPILTSVALDWCGLPNPDPRRTADELMAMIENAGRFSPATLRALLLRRRHETVVRGWVGAIRSGELTPGRGAPAREIAEHRNLDGALLDEATAAVEIINLLRPIVAIGHFIAFSAIALARHAEWRETLSDDRLLEGFVEEVRRVYPFFPVVGGRATEGFGWDDRHIPEGTWMLLDLYGTNLHPESFREPFRFDPKRDRSWQDQSFAFIPQGGGHADMTHRCPGERITVELMKVAARAFGTRASYAAPAVERLPMNRFPALPSGGVRLTEFKATRPWAADVAPTGRAGTPPL